MQIIKSNNFIKHMNVHELDFIVPYNKLIVEFETSLEFQSIDDDFEVVVKDYKRPVAYKTLVDLTENDEIIYAKRNGRESYTKFIESKRDKEKTSKVTFVLKRNNNDISKYFLITMYPGEPSQKEPEDKNIKSLNELKESVDFWDKKALLLRREDIQVDTIRKDCPYVGYLINKVVDIMDEQVK